MHKFLILFAFFITASLIFLFNPFITHAQAANRFWVGGSGTWDNATTTNWSTSTGGGGGASVPTASDAVIFDANSFTGAGQTVTLGTSPAANSMNWTGATNSPTFAMGTSILTIASGQAGGNLTFISGMTVTGTTATITTANTSGTVQITTAGQTLFNLTVNSAGGTTQLMDTNTFSAITLTTGTLNTNGQTCTWISFSSSGSGTRTLTLGSSGITLNANTNATTPFQATGSNLTFTANTATLNLSLGVSGPNVHINNDFNTNGVSLNITASNSGAMNFDSSTGGTYANITSTNANLLSLLFNGPNTFTGTANLSGTSISNRIYVGSGILPNNRTRGISRTISAATWTLSNINFEDINAAGAGTFSSAATVGDLGGNSGNFAGRTSTTYYWIGNTGNYTDGTHWSLSSGGAAANTIPLPQDTARFDANSFTTTGRVVTIPNVATGKPELGSIDSTGSTNSPALVDDNAAFYGSINLAGTMTFSNNGFDLIMSGRGNTTITSSSNLLVGRKFFIDTVSGTVSLGSNINYAGILSVTTGNFNSNGNTITLTGFASNNSNTRTINLTNSTINLTNATATAFDLGTTTPTGLTLIPNNTTWNLTTSSTTAYTINPNNQNIGTLNITGSGTGTITFGSNSSGSSTMNLASVSAPHTLIFTAGKTYNFTGWGVIGTVGNLITLQSTTPGTAYTLNFRPGTTVSSDYLSIRDSTTTPINTWFAGYNSTNVSGNTNWIFSAPGYSVRAPGAYWKLDEGTGTTTSDSAANSNTGTLSGSTLPTWQTEDLCVSGKCLYFNGSSSYVAAGNGTTVQVTGNLSLGAWIRLSNTSAVHDIISKKGASGSFGYRLYTDTSGHLNMEVSSDGTATTTVTGNTVLTANQWYHVAGVFIPSTSLTVFVNGIQDNQNTTSIPASINNTSTNVNLGAENAGASNFLAGFIDDAKVYPYARSSSQIFSDYNAHSNIIGASSNSISNTNLNGFLSNGLVGYWKMDESSWTVDCSTTSVIDSSGNSNNGKSCPNSTGPTGGAAGKFGNAGSFDGSNDYVEVPHNSNLSLTTFTVSAWINITSDTNYGFIVTKGVTNGNTTNNYELRVTPHANGTKVQLVGITGVGTTGATTLATGTWYHILGTYDGTTTKVYVNGSLDGSSTSGSFNTTTNPVEIGTRADRFTYYSGKLDDIRIYNRALSSQDAANLYNFGPGPVGYWNFNEGTGTSVNDTSGSAFTGTWNGTLGKQWTKNGKYGNAGNFNGTDNFVSTTDTPNISSGFTFSFWANPNNLTGDHAVLGTNGGVTSTEIRLRSPTLLDVILGGFTDGTNSYRSVPISISLNQWVHLAVTFDGSIAKVYQNGTLIGTKTITTPTSAWASALAIGKRDPTTTEYFSGQIDDVKAYNYARTQAQIIQDMNAGNPTAGASLSNLSAPIGYWKYDEGYGTTANNSGSQGSALNGTLSGSTQPSWSLAGKFNKALSFGGTNAYVAEGSDVTALKITSDLTLSGWINLTNTSSQHDIICKYTGTTATSAYCLTVNSSGKLQMLLVNSTGPAVVTTTSNATLATGTWYYVAGVFRSATSATLYINGVQDIQNTTSIPTTLQNTTTILNVGGENAGTNLMNGLIDEPKVYNYALSPSQILVDMNRSQVERFGTLGSNSSYQTDAINQIYCVPGDATSCTAPIGDWELNEGTGTSANDTSGNANTGTWGGTLGKQWVQNGRNSNGGTPAGNFNGTDSDVSITTSSSLDPTAQMTIEAWIKPTAASLAKADAFVVYNRSPNNKFIFEVGTNNLYFQVYQSNGTLKTSQNPTTLSANTWYHVVGVADGTNVKTYINGVVNNGVSYDGTINSSVAGLTHIGGGNLSTRYFGGLIDKVVFYNYARTPAQIAYDYNRGLPVGWWKFDEGTGTTAHDSSSNAYNGTVTIGASGTQTLAGDINTSGSAWANGKTGKYNYSLNFDGTDDFITVSAFSPLSTAGQTTTKLSWGGWFYPTRATTAETLIDKPSEFHLLKNSSDQIFCGFGSIGAGNDGGNVAITLNTWNHVVCTYDGTSVKTYINGLIKDTTAKSANITATSSILYMAEKNDATQRYQGQIDDLRIYNYPLTATQIQQVYNQGFGTRFGPVTGAP